MTDFEKKRAGKYLREFIKTHFASCTDFADFLGISCACVTNYMYGRRKVPGELLERLKAHFPEDLPLRQLRPDLYALSVKRYDN